MSEVVSWACFEEGKYLDPVSCRQSIMGHLSPSASLMEPCVKAISSYSIISLAFQAADLCKMSLPPPPPKLNLRSHSPAVVG